MPIKTNKEFSDLTGREPESARRINELSLRREFKTSKVIAQTMLDLFSSYQYFRKDFDKWQPTEGTAPFVGGVNGCPNLRGIMVATNGIEGFVISSSTYAFFCHFSNFILDDYNLQGEMNSCVMPFKMWLQMQAQQRVNKRDSLTRQLQGWIKKNGRWCQTGNSERPFKQESNRERLKKETLLRLFT